MFFKLFPKTGKIFQTFGKPLFLKKNPQPKKPVSATRAAKTGVILLKAKK
jgi:hypothetical protein